MPRAINFIKALLGFKMEAQQPGDEETALLHWRESGTGSSDLLVKHERHN
ncbi:hypothetical protein [Pontibacter kalidii]|nr:hypothetical protein [Pontibacter kalidii]